MPITEVFLGVTQQFLFQLIDFVPKLIVALIIWIVGKFFIGWSVRLIKKVKKTGVKPADKLIDSFVFIVAPVGKLLLFFVILDYLGIGRTVIQAVLSGLSFAIAIALGIAFGRALEGDARTIVSRLKEKLEG